MRLCGAFHVLPQPGGLYDQDCLWVEFAKKVYEFDEIRRKIDESRQKVTAQ